MMQIGNYVLIKTCGAFPEQYDVMDGPIKVGYLKLRHGYFSAQCPDHMGPVVYDAYPCGDGEFFEHERFGYLQLAINKVKAFYES